MEQKLFHHHAYYFIELIILLVGFFLVSFVAYNFYLELTILAAVLCFYALLGILHHVANHDLKWKIVVEYVLISCLLFSVFIFLNSGKL